MSTKASRINHAAEARRILACENGPGAANIGWETADAQHLANIHEAQVHATLALVEQQRIANLIALAGLTMDGPLRHLVVKPDGPFCVDVADEIREALGL